MTERQHIAIQCATLAIAGVTLAYHAPWHDAIYLAWLAYWGASMWNEWGIYAR